MLSLAFGNNNVLHSSRFQEWEQVTFRLSSVASSNHENWHVCPNGSDVFYDDTNTKRFLLLGGIVPSWMAASWTLTIG